MEASWLTLCVEATTSLSVGPGKNRNFLWQKPLGHLTKTAISRDISNSNQNHEIAGKKYQMRNDPVAEIKMIYFQIGKFGCFAKA